MTTPDRLGIAVEREIGKGGRLQSHAPHEAVVKYGSGNVLMHATFGVLTLFSCGLFAFPWIVWANTSRERRVVLAVDARGRVIRRV